MTTTPKGSDVSNSDYLISLVTGILLAYCIAVATVAAVNVTIPLMAGREIEFPPKEEWGILLLHIAMIAFPFGLLALAHVWKPLPWIIGILMTAAFWGLVVYSAVTSTGDPNIGLGVLMLFSPLIILGGVFTPVIISDLNG
jgi:hypothetical protein